MIKYVVVSLRSMASIEELRDMITETLDEEEENRERAYSLSRDLIRYCRRFISDLISGREMMEAELVDSSMELIELAQDPRCQRYGFIDDSLTELSEAIILCRSLRGEDLPTPHEINVNERSFLLGSCDAIGEMRRVVLNNLLDKKVEEAENVFERMRELSYMIEGLSYPSGFIPLKKKQDVVRSLMDRTAGELTFAKFSIGKGDRR